MREVPRDEKWIDAENDGEAGTEFEAVLESTGPSETELVMVALLMRLYDINMALLSHVNKQTADSIYEAHEKGGHFNPPIFIPTASETEDVD